MSEHEAVLARARDLISTTIAGPVPDRDDEAYVGVVAYGHLGYGSHWYVETTVAHATSGKVWRVRRAIDDHWASRGIYGRLASNEQADFNNVSPHSPNGKGITREANLAFAVLVPLATAWLDDSPARLALAVVQADDAVRQAEGALERCERAVVIAANRLSEYRLGLALAVEALPDE